LLAESEWPVADSGLLVEKEVTIAVQINGKLCTTIIVPKDSSKEALEAAALQDEKVIKALANRDVRRVIAVLNRIVNVVI